MFPENDVFKSFTLKCFNVIIVSAQIFANVVVKRFYEQICRVLQICDRSLSVYDVIDFQVFLPKGLFTKTIISQCFREANYTKHLKSNAY